MNGLEFCRNINDIHVKMILLSGKADEKTAIIAFNQDIIDKYITKHDPLVLERLQADIDLLQKQYHCDLYQYVSNTIICEKTQFMCEKQFHGFLDKLCDKFNIVEFYYAFDEYAYILLDHEGKVYTLKIATQESEIQEHNNKNNLVTKIHRLPIDQQYYYTFSPSERKIIGLSSYQDFVKSKNHKHAALYDSLLCDQYKHQYFITLSGNKIYLTQREAQCLYFLLKGYTAKQIGIELYLSLRTIQDYTNQLKKKLALPSKQHIVASINSEEIIVA